jgi:DNA-binding NarL/FixJ family response regulator
MLTTYDHDEYVFDALAAGASRFLLKDSRPEDLTPRCQHPAQARSARPRLVYLTNGIVYRRNPLSGSPGTGVWKSSNHSSRSPGFAMLRLLR